MTADTVSKLLSCEDYRSFMLIYKDEKSAVKPFSYSMISNRAGFSSSSFPRDVAHGTKRITIASLFPMIKGLGLKGDMADFFKTLVYIEHPDTCFPEKTTTELKNKLSNLRDRIVKKRKVTDFDDPYKAEFFPMIYAACGDSQTGATLEQIRDRTGLIQSQVDATLKFLISMDLISFRKDKYFTKESHLFFEGLDQSEPFKKLFFYLLNQASESAKKKFKSDENLYFTSCFSVKRRNMPKLKSDLRQVILQYVDESEDSDGDKVASLVCALI